MKSLKALLYITAVRRHLSLQRALGKSGANIIGTSPDSIDLAEDRERFQKMIKKLNLKQPVNDTARSQEEAVKIANSIGFPSGCQAILCFRRSGYGNCL